MEKLDAKDVVWIAAFVRERHQCICEQKARMPAEKRKRAELSAAADEEPAYAKECIDAPVAPPVLKRAKLISVT